VIFAGKAIRRRLDNKSTLRKL